jgi:hypothetical protein
MTPKMATTFVKGAKYCKNKIQSYHSVASSISLLLDNENKIHFYQIQNY